ncbi:MAG: NAD(+) synthase [Acidobacteria bacterium]|nr:NAD(+) synthase [Acidobacteriota bacterium]
MRIALAQINPVSGDIDRNTARIIDAIAAASSQGAELVVLPEMCLPGYCIGDLVEDLAFLEANERAMHEIARASRGVTAVVGFIDVDPAMTNDNGTMRKYNAAAVVRDGQVLQRARKSLLPNYRYFDDKRFFTAGERREAVDVPVAAAAAVPAGSDPGERNRSAPSDGEGTARIGVSICEDMWDEFYDIKPLQELAAQGATVLLNLNASPFYPGKRRIRERLIREHIARVHRPIVYVNTVGAADTGKNIIPFDGESLVYDAAGRLVAIGRQFEEDLIVVDVGGAAAPRPEIPLPPDDHDRELFDALVMALRDYMGKTGFTRAMVPVSGGIDSALALAIAADALGPDRVLAYNLPSRYNTETTRSIADRLASAFGVRYGIIPIQDIDETVRRVFEAHAHPIAQNLTRENLHARIRGLLMMAESNDTGALLISCGNETEIALGYATLYGDMCGGISLIGDLSKVDVYRVARYVNRRHGREMIPEETFRIKPSAELAAGQFDPFDYAVVAPIVGEFAEHRTSPEALVRLFEQRALDPARFRPDDEGRSVYDKYTAESFRAIVHDAYRRMRRSVYKRLQGPPIVVVSERAFGFDLRETIINGWEG